MYGETFDRDVTTILLCLMFVGNQVRLNVTRYEVRQGVGRGEINDL